MDIPRPSKGHILIVDDDENFCQLLMDFAQELGFEATYLTDTEDLFEQIPKIRPNVITLDLQMPRHDGLEILSRLRENPLTKDMPVVIISVIAETLSQQLLGHRATGIFTKPLNFHKLSQTLIPYLNM